VATRWKKPGTAIAAIAWIAVCAYFYLAWPSLTALLATLDSIPPALVRVPRVAFPILGLLAAIGLEAKDRWMSAPCALATDAVIGAPAFALIALLLDPFLFPVE